MFSFNSATPKTIQSGNSLSIHLCGTVRGCWFWKHLYLSSSSVGFGNSNLWKVETGLFDPKLGGSCYQFASSKIWEKSSLIHFNSSKIETLGSYPIQNRNSSMIQDCSVEKKSPSSMEATELLESSDRFEVRTPKPPSPWNGFFGTSHKRLCRYAMLNVKRAPRSTLNGRGSNELNFTTCSIHKSWCCRSNKTLV